MIMVPLRRPGLLLFSDANLFSKPGTATMAQKKNHIFKEWGHMLHMFPYIVSTRCT